MSASKEWLRQPVHAFFTACRWSNCPIADPSQTAADHPRSQLQLSVKRFFTTVAWEGAAIPAAPAIDPSARDAAETVFTLSQFSELF